VSLSSRTFLSSSREQRKHGRNIQTPCHGRKWDKQKATNHSQPLCAFRVNASRGRVRSTIFRVLVSTFMSCRLTNSHFYWLPGIAWLASCEFSAMLVQIWIARFLCRDEGFRFCGCDWRGMVLRVRLRDGTTAGLGGGVSGGCVMSCMTVG
jgi:hypothetical protein